MSNEMQDWLKISKLLCYKPLISTVLLILHFIRSLDGTTIDSQNYRYFHLKFLPSPWKSSLCLAAVVKRREEMKHWKKLFFTEATKGHPCRSHGWMTPSANQGQMSTGNQSILCTDCTGSAGSSLPLVPPWEHGIWTSNPQAQTTCNRYKFNSESFVCFLNSEHNSKISMPGSFPNTLEANRKLWYMVRNSARENSNISESAKRSRLLLPQGTTE